DPLPVRFSCSYSFLPKRSVMVILWLALPNSYVTSVCSFAGFGCSARETFCSVDPIAPPSLPFLPNSSHGGQESGSKQISNQQATPWSGSNAQIMKHTWSSLYVGSSVKLNNRLVCPPEGRLPFCTLVTVPCGDITVN